MAHILTQWQPAEIIRDVVLWQRSLGLLVFEIITQPLPL
jgi:hypothetical protein